MKVSLLGPTNIDRLSTVILNKLSEEIKKIANNIGKVLGQNKCQLVVVFNYSGMLKLIGDAFKANGGKLEMLYTENDYDWHTGVYMDNLKEADIKTKKDSWHDVLVSLVRDSDLVICAGLSPGVFTELGYIKWDLHEKRGKLKALIGIKEFLRYGEFPPEVSESLKEIITTCSVNELDKVIKKHLSS